MKELPNNPFPQDAYPSFFGLFQNKPALLSKINKEDHNLGKAVLRYIENGVMEGFKILNRKGKPDMLIRIKPLDKLSNK